LFIAPHADDIEVLVASSCLAAVQAGWEVHECLACADEYGVSQPDFKGPRIARIRKWEMREAARRYGTTPEGELNIQLHWMPYIDGHVPFTIESVRRYQTLIQTIRPTIVFLPDPFFPVGLHQDHLNTGYNAFFALKRLPPAERPRVMLMYQTYCTDVALPFADRQFEYRVRMAHRSQFHPVLMKIFGFFGLFWRFSPSHGGHRVDRCRRVRFDAASNRAWGPGVPLGLRLKTVLAQYLFKAGRPHPGFFLNPPVEDIMRDYGFFYERGRFRL
jgi:LmbE family N-acetylglucosaminyl deacetylase